MKRGERGKGACLGVWQLNRKREPPSSSLRHTSSRHTKTHCDKCAQEGGDQRQPSSRVGCLGNVIPLPSPNDADNRAETFFFALHTHPSPSPKQKKNVDICTHAGGGSMTLLSSVWFLLRIVISEPRSQEAICACARTHAHTPKYNDKSTSLSA